MLPHAPRKPHSTPVQEPDDSDHLHGVVIEANCFSQWPSSESAPWPIQVAATLCLEAHRASFATCARQIYRAHRPGAVQALREQQP